MCVYMLYTTHICSACPLKKRRKKLENKYENYLIQLIIIHDKIMFNIKINTDYVMTKSNFDYLNFK